MSPEALLQRYRSAQRQRNLLVLCVLLLIISTCALSLRVASGFNQTVLLPTRLGDGMVAKGAVDRAYIEALALDTAQAMFTIHGTSLEYDRLTMERVAHPSNRARLLEEFDAQAEVIKERKISTVLDSNRLTTDLSELRVVIDGFLTTYLDKTQIERAPKQVIVGFERQAGSVRVSHISIAEGATR